MCSPSFHLFKRLELLHLPCAFPLFWQACLCCLPLEHFHFKLRKDYTSAVVRKSFFPSSRWYCWRLVHGEIIFHAPHTKHILQWRPFYGDLQHTFMLLLNQNA